jgi:hypothetical protein
MTVRNEMTQKQDEAYSLYQLVQAMQEKDSANFFTMGRALYKIKKDKLYRYMGEGALDNWKQFVNQPEIKIPYSSANQKVEMYRYYILQLGFTDDEIKNIPVNRLIRIKPRLAEGPDEKARETVQDAMNLTNFDFQEFAKERKLTIKVPKKVICKECGKWRLIGDEEQICPGHTEEQHVQGSQNVVVQNVSEEL